MKKGSDFKLEVIVQVKDAFKAHSLVLEQLKESGKNLSKPQNIKYYLYFSSKENAVLLGEDLRALGYIVRIDLSAGGGDWLVLAEKEELLTEDRLRDLWIEMELLCRKFKGNYDGWEVSSP